MNRREFLKLLGKGAAGAALGVCALEMAQRERVAPEWTEIVLNYRVFTDLTATAELDPPVGTLVNGEISRWEGMTFIGGGDNA